MLQDFCAPKEVAAAFAFQEANSDSVDTSDGLDLNLNLQLDDEHNNDHDGRDEVVSPRERNPSAHADMLKNIKKWLQQADDSLEYSFAMYDILLTSMKSQFAHARESKAISVEGELTPFLSLARTQLRRNSQTALDMLQHSVSSMQRWEEGLISMTASKLRMCEKIQVATPQPCLRNHHPVIVMKNQVTQQQLVELDGLAGPRQRRPGGVGQLLST